MSIKISSLIKIKEFNRSVLIAGSEGLDNEITSITVSEVPDSAMWLKSGELVLTTGYFISQNENIQRDWIEGLIKHGAAALAIKTDRFLVKMSDTIIQLANEKKFPIIELPSDIIWPTLIEGVMNEVSNYQKRIIDTTYRIHNELTSIVISGGGIKLITDKISELVSNTVLVEDLFLNDLAISIPGNHELNDITIDNKMIREDYRREFRDSIFYKNVCKCTEFDTHTLKGFRDTSVLNSYKKITMPIIADCMVLGFVSIIESEKESSDIDLIALEHGSTVIALEMMKEQIISNKTLKEKKNFLNYLLGLTDNLNENAYYREKYSFSLNRPVAVIYMEINVDSISTDYKSSMSNKLEVELRKIIKAMLNEVDKEGLYVSDGGVVEILLHFDSKESRKKLESRIEVFCNRFIGTLREEFGEVNYNIGVSGFHVELNKIKQSYDESKKALEIGRVFKGYNKIHFYDDQGFYKILFQVDNKEVISEYCSSILGPILKYDMKNKSDNYNLLKSYIMNDSNLAKTAEINYLHPNTLAYRLKKIEELLGIDLKEVKHKFNLYMAFILQEIV